MNRYFQELKRRKVFKTLGVYRAVSIVNIHPVAGNMSVYNFDILRDIINKITFTNFD